jgi:hypothetical protein
MDIVPAAANRALDLAVDDFSQYVFVFEIAHPAAPVAPLTGWPLIFILPV